MSPTAPTDLDSQASPLTTSPTSPTSPLSELSGTVLDGRYALGRALGAGGMGAVFEAQDQLLHRRVAIKVMRPAYAQRDGYIKRFLREAQAVSKIRHRNVVVSLDYGEAEGGLVYSVMELLVGQDLKQVLARSSHGRLPWSEARELLIQITSGLKAAHDQGVIHRDIKPANCFVTEEDDQPVVKVVDFGIAKVDDSPEAEQITRTSQVLGTPSYIAPELVRTKGAASPRSDVYSLGVMAYRMLTGNLPFIGETAFEVMYRACTESAPRLRKQVPELPAAVEDLVLEMLAKDPSRRPATMAEVRERLRALAGTQAGVGGGRRRSLRLLGAGALAAALGMLAWVAMGPQRQEEGLEVDGTTAMSMREVPPEDGIAVERNDAGVGADARVVQPEGAPPVEREAAEPPIAAQGVEAPGAPSRADEVEDEVEPRRRRRTRATPPKDPPSDEVLTKKLQHEIKAKCGGIMKGDRVTVIFAVTQSGEPESPTSMSKNAAGECAIQQVRGMQFRPRKERTLLKVFVD